MLSNQSNKRPVESFVVSLAGESLVAATTALHGTTSPYPVNMNDGQIGIFSESYLGSVDKYVAVAATPTVAQAPVLSFYQGTSDSANPQNYTYGSPLTSRPYEQTGAIDGTQKVLATYQAYEAPTFSVNFVGGPTNGQITALDNTNYSLRVAFRGRVQDELYNPEGANQLTISIPTPNFTTLATAEPEDWIYQYTIWEMNRNSVAMTIDKPSRRGNYPIVGFAIDTTGATGGTIVNALAPGFVPLVNTTLGVRGLVMTQLQLDSLAAGVTAAGYNPAVATVLVADLATAGTVTGGVADAFMTLAVDRSLAFSDKIPQIKNYTTIGLTTGYDYNSVYNAQVQLASEGQGQARSLDILYRDTHGQRKYWGQHEMDPIVEYPSPVVLTESYDTFIVQHEDSEQIDTSNVAVSPQKAIILIPTADAATVAAVRASLDSWLASGGNPTVRV